MNHVKAYCFVGGVSDGSLMSTDLMPRPYFYAYLPRVAAIQD